MIDPGDPGLKGRRLLLVEDDYLIAADLTRTLERLGAEVLGPAGSVEDALDLLATANGRLDGAVLDINLGDEQVFPVADALMAQDAPFVFVTGYDAVVIPEAYGAAPRLEKPVDRGLLLRTLRGAGLR